ncbi:hypothetical protein [Sphingomonas immobilis]|uniref:Uncharacterized protein n=1 Tax=Sphingomonas immobilis TaxID=3063997 RepID=A0ABT8ZX14_9SPHN|nr:hypothetical protein [Sphingomonas sp. CA1-15]MDO7841818.1 hypothetical protein [Sphingomonas sp. CA1-15]
MFDPVLAARFRYGVLAHGNDRDPATSFIDFRGRPPEELSLLRDRHLV